MAMQSGRRAAFRRGIAIGTLGLAVALALLGILSPHLFEGFVEKHLSSDHVIAGRTAGTIQALAISFGGLLSAVGLVLFVRPLDPRRSLRRLLQVDGETRTDQYQGDLLWLGASSVVAVLMVSVYFLRPWLSESPVMRFLLGEDGFFETLTAILALGAGVLYLLIALRLKRSIGPEGHQYSRAARVLLILASGACVLFALEEISWGQRLFGWETPLLLQRSNCQGEANLHNLVGALAQVLNWGLTAYCVLSVLSWFGGLRRRILWIALLLPHTCLVPLVCVGLFATGEIQEEIASALLFLHTLRRSIYMRSLDRSSADVEV